MMATKTPFELCPACLEQGKQHRVSIVSEKGTPCYWCKTIVEPPKEES